MLDRSLDNLLAYAVDCELIDPADQICLRNALLAMFGETAYQPAVSETPAGGGLAAILDELSAEACRRQLITDSSASRELFDTALMGVLTPKPSEVIRRFRNLYEQSPAAATAFFYRFCQDCNYIRRDRTERDLRWQTPTPYGDLDITINLAKPEKDPRDIAAARAHPAGGYPACVLCAENEGYAGHSGHPARQNLRIMPLDILGEDWGFQYSPYVYYNEHCIVLNRRHVPMVIDERVFAKLFAFVRQFPDYFIGSNADLPIVGGSILSHEHFQGGRHSFAMEKAPVERTFMIPGHPDVAAGIVRWPMSVIRLAHPDPDQLTPPAALILKAWRAYADEAAGIRPRTGDVPHSTITPIARRRGGQYELDLVLRNNITTAEHPLGLFHPHAELHNIKKENIGLIEVMGLAVLPGRLAHEMQQVQEALLAGRELDALPETARHAAWVASWRHRHPDLNAGNIEGVIRSEIGLTFAQVLEHAGVFARTAAGQSAFDRFIASLREH